MALRLESKGQAVRSVQEMLIKLGFRVKVTENGITSYQALEPDGYFGPKTESAVIDFQQSEGLLRDGVVGPGTMKALEEAYTIRVLELNSPGVDATDGMPDRFVFERVKADPYGEGYDRLSLRNDVASEYNEIYGQVHQQGGILTSSGGIRGLKTKVNASRSVTSFHYLGRALDLYIFSGMVDPESDPYVIAREKERAYRIYARCSLDNNSQAELPDEQIIENVITYEDRKEGVEVRGSFLDLTELFNEHGFKPIHARRKFEEGGSMMGAEWWHFQYVDGLVEYSSTFGSELLKVYSEKTLEGTAPWNNKERIFGVNWG